MPECGWTSKRTGLGADQSIRAALVKNPVVSIHKTLAGTAVRFGIARTHARSRAVVIRILKKPAGDIALKLCGAMR